MNKVEIRTDTRDLEKLYFYISGKEWERIEKRALNKAAAVVKKNTVDELKTLLPASKHKSQKYNDRLVDAVKKSKTRAKTGVTSTAVHILGSTKTGSGTFRARFFEGGTKERVGKNGASRGKIEPLRFFETGRSKSSQAMNEMTSFLLEEINKLNNKKFK